MISSLILHTILINRGAEEIVAKRSALNNSSERGNSPERLGDDMFETKDVLAIPSDMGYVRSILWGE